MANLVFLLISIVLTGILIYAVPMGLTRKEKNIAIVGSVLFGSFGLVSVNFVGLWQVLLVIVLLGMSAGYIIVSRLSVTKVPVKLNERLHSNVDNESLDLYGKVSNFVDEKDHSAIEVLPANNKNHETLNEIQPSFDEDTSFLDERNGVHIPQVEWVNPAPNMELEDWMVEPEKEKAYASIHS
ncbi:hypothetical protein AB5I83_00535 [Mesobacillus sp. LC4]